MKQFSSAILVLALAALAAGAMPAARAQTAAAGAGMQGMSAGANIAAVVNGQVITDDDVAARARLLAVSTGMPMTPDTLNRLQPQITEQLVDQTLQLQEINRRGVVVKEDDIEAAVSHIEQGNNMPAGALRGRLEAAGVPFSTLIAQLRTQLGWQDVLHQVLGPELRPTPGDIGAEKKALQAQIGQTEYHLAEIFIPVPDPADDAAAHDFAATVITQLRAGAPFPVIAAQFSQADSALQGGDLGFVSPSQLDPATAAVVTQMPAGAISNPDPRARRLRHCADAGLPAGGFRNADDADTAPGLCPVQHAGGQRRRVGGPGRGDREAGPGWPRRAFLQRHGRAERQCWPSASGRSGADRSGDRDARFVPGAARQLADRPGEPAAGCAGWRVGRDGVRAADQRRGAALGR